MGLSFGKGPHCVRRGVYFTVHRILSQSFAVRPRDPSKAVCACVCPSSGLRSYVTTLAPLENSFQPRFGSIEFPVTAPGFSCFARRQLAAYPTRTIDVSVAPFMCHSTKLRSRRRFPLPSASLNPCRPKPFRLLLCGRARLCCITKLLHAGSGSSRDFVTRRKHPPHQHHDA